jgi:hypothetical protein
VNRSTGYVGINTSSPGSQLHVVGTIQSTAAGNSGRSVMGVTGGNGTVYVTNPDGLTRVQMSATTDAGGRLDVDDGSGIARAGMYVNGEGLGYVYTGRVDFPETVGDKVLLYGSDPTGNYGIGIQSSLLQIHASSSGSSIAFGYGGSENFTERMRVTGSGRVGIGTSTPTQALDVRGNIKRNDAGDMYATGGQENLYLVRGIVDGAGAIVKGSGYTVSRTGEGRYTVTFTKAEFDEPPAVAITPWTNSPVLAVVPLISGTIGQPAKFTVITYLNGAPSDCAFSFIATANH